MVEIVLEPLLLKVMCAVKSYTAGCDARVSSNRAPLRSEWLRDLPGLAKARLGVFVLLPADGVHRVSGFAGGHDDTELIARSSEVVIGLITERDLHSYVSQRFLSYLARESMDTHDLCPDNITRTETLVDLDAVLLGSPDVLDTDYALPVGLENSFTDDQDCNGGLAWLDARHPAQDDVADLGQNLALLLVRGSRAQDRDGR